MSQNTVLLHNRYRVRSILGTGGFSTIYLAVDETTGTEVSVKEFTAEHMDGLATALRVNAYDIANRSEPQPVPDPSDLSGEEKLSRGLMQVRREAQMLDLFSGVPGVPGVLDTFQENNTFYLVKEYLEGMTCKEYMDRFRGRMPFTLALYIMKGTLEILQAIHSRGYIHCDISPINSFLCRDGGSERQYGRSRSPAGSQYTLCGPRTADQRPHPDPGHRPLLSVRHDIRRCLRRTAQTMRGASAG